MNKVIFDFHLKLLIYKGLLQFIGNERIEDINFYDNQFGYFKSRRIEGLRCLQQEHKALIIIKWLLYFFLSNI